MEKEILLQEKLLGPFQQTRNRIESAQRGHLPNGKTLEDLPLSILGSEFAPKVIIGALPESATKDSLTISGGWCTLRLVEAGKLEKERVLLNPVTGTEEPITSIQQVANWLQDSIAFDQVVEAIGPILGNEYVAISESRLWAKRILIAVENSLGKLKFSERKFLIQAVEDAEKKRALLTERYLQLVLGKSVRLRRITDREIWGDLRKAQQELFSKSGLSVASMAKEFSNGNNNLSSRVLVFSLYSEPYFAMLRRKGLVTNQNVVISEPTIHTRTKDLAGNAVIQAVYQANGKYGQPGINPNTGFVAFMECLWQGNEKGKGKGEPVRDTLAINQVPNTSNWRELFSNGFLNPTQEPDLDPLKNPLFVWGVNLIPFGKTRQTLLKLLEVKEQFIDEKKNVKLNSKEDADNFKRKFLDEIKQLNQNLAQDLWDFFERMTEGL